MAAEEVVATQDAPTASTARTWPHTVKLTCPVEWAKEQIASLTFRRGRIGDLEGAKTDEVPSVDRLLLIASRLCGQPVAMLKQLDMDDGSEVLELALDFFGRCLGAGKMR